MYVDGEFPKRRIRYTRWVREQVWFLEVIRDFSLLVKPRSQINGKLFIFGAAIVPQTIDETPF